MADNYDTPWKDALTRYFPDFLCFYFPAAHAAIDWSRPHAFLDAELAALAHDGTTGRRIADKLVQVHTLAGGEQWVLVHIEVQAQRDTALAERIFTYNYRTWHTAKTRGAVEARAAAKWRLTKLLFQRDWNKERIQDLYFVIDWMMSLPLEHERVFWDRVATFAKESNMAWISTGERIGRIDGMKEGLKIGREEGRKEGREEGREEGRRQATADVIADLLQERFGALPASARDRLNAAPMEQLSAWIKATVKAQTLDEVFR